MLGRNHIWLSCTSLLVLVSPWLATRPTDVLLLIAGAWVGALLPDVDSNSSRILRGGAITRAIGLVARWFLFLLVGILFRLIGSRFRPEHRGSMHTLIGIGFYSLVIAGAAYGAAQLATQYTGVPYWSDGLWIVIDGMVLGGVMHLVEDSCTARGIMPFLPVWGKWFHGGITTGNPRDKRPEIYGTVLAGEVAALVLLQQALQYPQEQVIQMAVAAFGASWAIFYLLSKFDIKTPDEI
jgi:membrane-bound metal-dependent hydrolase YbcI (DUF457 family)